MGFPTRAELIKSGAWLTKKVEVGAFHVLLAQPDAISARTLSALALRDKDALGGESVAEKVGATMDLLAEVCSLLVVNDDGERIFKSASEASDQLLSAIPADGARSLMEAYVAFVHKEEAAEGKDPA